jgi:hypothetical protein
LLGHSKQMVWKKEGEAAKLLKLALIYCSSCYLFYGCLSCQIMYKTQSEVFLYNAFHYYKKKKIYYHHPVYRLTDSTVFIFTFILSVYFNVFLCLFVFLYLQN